MENNNLNVFSKILLFLNELNAMFGDKYKNVFLYYKLCKKTTISNTNGITKHVEYFNRFLLPNKENILRKNFKDLNPTEIRFDKSEKVFVNVQEIMKNTDKPTREVMFKHLHFLLCLVNPDDKSLQQSLLKDVPGTLKDVPGTLKDDVTKISVGDSSEKETKESSFINNFVSKVKNNFETSSSQSSNPMEMAMQLMQSGVFSDITSQMKDGLGNGELKIDKLVSNVQSMIGNLTSSLNNVTEENQSDNNDSQSSTDTISSLMNMTQSLMSSISPNQSASNNTDSPPPEIDLSKINLSR